MDVSGPVGSAGISQAEILSFLKEIAAKELELSEAQVAQIGLETPILEGLQLDSVSQVVLLTQIEEKYGFLFEPEDGGDIETIKDFIEMIQRRAAMRES